MNIKKVILFILIGWSSSIQAQTELSTFILVRHAEKVDNSADPDINQQGSERAIRLAALLKETKLTHIYASDFKRTRLTVKAVSDEHQLTPEIYNSKKIENLAMDLQRLPAGSTVLVVGHTNTTPQLANLLLGKPTYRAFEESDYGNIIVVTTGKKQSAHSLLLRF